jgi:hypothetical protein
MDNGNLSLWRASTTEDRRSVLLSRKEDRISVGELTETGLEAARDQLFITAFQSHPFKPAQRSHRALWSDRESQRSWPWNLVHQESNGRSLSYPLKSMASIDPGCHDERERDHRFKYSKFAHYIGV